MFADAHISTLDYLWCGREQCPNFEGLFTTKVIKSHVKLHVKSNATKIPRESTPYITLAYTRVSKR